MRTSSSQQLEKAINRFYKVGYVKNLLMIVLISFFLTQYAIQSFGTEENDYVGVIEINGIISDDSKNSPNKIALQLDRAFRDDLKGIVIKINSPGGTPVASDVIRADIKRRIEANSDVKTIVYGMETMASGAYMIAMASDKVFAHESSVVGSVGVRAESFDVSSLANELGIEKRRVTAGEHKGRWDIFYPATPEDNKKMQSLVDKMHAQFIRVVKTSRGSKLSDDPLIFSGDVWVGSEAEDLGLIDGVGDYYDILDKQFNTTKEKYYKPTPTLKDLLGDSVKVMTGALLGDLNIW